MIGKNKRDKLSVFISLVLRHKPEAANVEVDKYGYVDVDNLIKGINATGRDIDIETLKQIVSEDQKGRYSFNEDLSKIRANQGHSLKVQVLMETKTPPDVLYHGTSIESLKGIFETGINKMNRLYVHLSDNEETAKIVGKRHGYPVILMVDAKEMVKDNYEFLISENGVWQVEDVPLKYVKVVSNCTTIHANDPGAVVERLKELLKYNK